MNTYAPPPTRPSPLTLPTPPSRPSRSSDPSQPPFNPATQAITVGYASSPPLPSVAPHYPPVQPHPHHSIPLRSWQHPHSRLKPNSSTLPPPSSQSTFITEPMDREQTSVTGKSSTLQHAHHIEHHAQHVPRPTTDQPPHPPHAFHHPLNVVGHHAHASPALPPSHPQSYVYPVHPVVSPVAHVPIGAAHYAHLPPSIWNPSAAHYHHPAHPQPHHMSDAQHAAPGAIPSHVHPESHYRAPHLHHIVASPHPAAHPYALHHPHAIPTSHTRPMAPNHAIHPSAHHPQHHITYTYAPVATMNSSQHAMKPSVSISPSHPLPVATHAQYTPPSSAPQRTAGAAVISTAPPSKYNPVLIHTRPDTLNHTSHGQKVSHDERKGFGTVDMGVDSAQGGNSPHDNNCSSSPDLSNHMVRSGELSERDRNIEHRKSSNAKQKSNSASGQPMRKPRKPYTITKSREVWTQEEHSRFLHALQLYDRDWKKIEAYISTKTVLQIRSHAQKHFGKVTKYKTGEYIPPPRPKKRAALPYPRSRSMSQGKSSSLTTGTASESAAGSDNGTLSGNGTNSSSDVRSKDRYQTSRHALSGKPLLQIPHSATAKDSSRVSVEGRDSHGDRTLLNAEVTTAADSRQHSGFFPYPEKRSSEHERRQDSDRGPGKDVVVRHTPGSLLKLPDQNPESSGNQTQDARREFKGRGSDSGDDTPTYRSNGVTHVKDMRRHDMMSKREADSVHEHGRRWAPHTVASVHVNELETSRSNEERRKSFAVPNNSLLVLSNCVDMMARDVPPERQPAAGWATAAAARRAHRAKVIRSRKPPLPRFHGSSDRTDLGHSPRDQAAIEVFATDGTRESPAPPRHQEDVGRNEPTNETDQDRATAGRSPSVESPPDYEHDRSSVDPQRSSSGSGTGSDDAIAGFSSSDRPSVSGSARGSGTGGSLELSDGGDPEEDPKSSNDGSGDDGNRRSPLTRHSSPADPTSSASREDSPTECSGAPTSDASRTCGEAHRPSDKAGSDERQRTEEAERLPPLSKLTCEGAKRKDCDVRKTLLDKPREEGAQHTNGMTADENSENDQRQKAVVEAVARSPTKSTAETAAEAVAEARTRVCRVEATVIEAASALCTGKRPRTETSCEDTKRACLKDGTAEQNSKPLRQKLSDLTRNGEAESGAGRREAELLSTL